MSHFNSQKKNIAVLVLESCIKLFLEVMRRFGCIFVVRVMSFLAIFSTRPETDYIEQKYYILVIQFI